MKENTNIDSLLQKFKSGTKFQKDRIHIIEVEDGWSVKRDGEKDEILTATTKNKAMDEVKKLAAVKSLVVHPKSGNIELTELE